MTGDEFNNVSQAVFDILRNQLCLLFAGENQVNPVNYSGRHYTFD
jgi:hypothetical protein